MSAAPLHVAQVVRPAAGGMRRHVEGLLRHAAPNVRSVLFAPADFVFTPPIPDVTHLPLDISPRPLPWRDRRSIQELTTMLPDSVQLLHAHGVRGAMIAVPAGKNRRLPVVFTAHNLPPSGALSSYLVRRLSAGTQRIIAVSQAVADSLGRLGASAERIVVIPNGIEIEPFDAPQNVAAFRAPYGVPAETPILLGVGRLAPEKGFDVLIEAARLLHRRRREFVLMLVGAGGEEARLRALAEGLPVVFAGFVADITPFYHAAEIVVVPSRQEGQGIVALEAMAARTPVIATRVGGLPETVQEGVTGTLVPPESSDALAEALMELLDAPDRRREMGAAGRRIVAAEYDVRQRARSVAAVYAECVGGT